MESGYIVYLALTCYLSLRPLFLEQIPNARVSTIVYSSFFFPLSPLLRAFIETCFPVSPHEKDLHESDNLDGVITHPEPDILE